MMASTFNSVTLPYFRCDPNPMLMAPLLTFHSRAGLDGAEVKKDALRPDPFSGTGVCTAASQTLVDTAAKAIKALEGVVATLAYEGTNFTNVCCLKVTLLARSTGINSVQQRYRCEFQSIR
jgi:hypothetical protein